MKTRSRLLVFVVVIAILGGLMALNHLTQPKTGDEHADEHTQTTKPGMPPMPKPPKIVKSIKLYLINARGADFSLQAVDRGLTAEQAKNPALAAMDFLCSGAGGSEDLQNPIPQNVKVMGVVVEHGTATVDFSPEMQRNFPGGSTWEALVIGAVVNTLTQFPEVRRVQILVGGKAVDSLGGHIDISKPLARDERFL